MTVAELVEKLKELPQDSEVVIVHNDWILKKTEVKGMKVILA